MPVKAKTHKPVRPDVKRHVVAETERGNANKRGYGYKWQIAREAYLKENPLCIECEAMGRIRLATDLDHKIPHRGNMTLFWDRDNWAGLCKSHHSAKTAQGL